MFILCVLSLFNVPVRFFIFININQSLLEIGPSTELRTFKTEDKITFLKCSMSISVHVIIIFLFYILLCLSLFTIFSSRMAKY